MSQAVIFIADGTEECEAISVIDLLRRAGIDIKTVAVKKGGEKNVLTAHNISMECDESLDDFELSGEEFLIIPGGLDGTNTMKACEPLSKMLKKQIEEGRKLAAICAGPTVLGELGLLEDKNCTCYPGCEDGLGKGAKFQDTGVVKDGNIITGQGLGSAIPFALRIIAEMEGAEKALEVADDIVYF